MYLFTLNDCIPVKYEIIIIIIIYFLSCRTKLIPDKFFDCLRVIRKKCPDAGKIIFIEDYLERTDLVSSFLKNLITIYIHLYLNV